MDELILDFIHLVGLDESAAGPIKLVGGVSLVSLLAFSFWYDARNNARKAREHAALWTVLANQLGLRLEGTVLKGEYDGMPVRIAQELLGPDDGKETYSVVRARVPGGLPRQFVAAPRLWTSRMERLLAQDSFKSGDAALDGYFIFQSEQPEEGKRFAGQAEALRGLIQPGQAEAIVFVEKGEVGIAQTSFLVNEEEARRRLEAVTGTARALAETQTQLTLTGAYQRRAKG